MLTKILKQLNIKSEYIKLFDALNEGKNVSVFGGSLGDKTLFLSGGTKPVLFVASNVKEATEINKEFKSLGLKTDTCFYKLNNFRYSDSEQNLSSLNYYNSLFDLAENKTEVLIITPEVLMQKLPSKKSFADHILEFKTGVTYDFNYLVKNLIKLGYNREDLVEDKGQFSLRGDILDIFPVNSDVPVRIAFFDEEVETIKTFNTVTYTTIQSIEEVKISPNTLIFIEEDELESLLLKLNKKIESSKLGPNYKTRLSNVFDAVKSSLKLGSRELNMGWILPFLDNYNSSILSYFNEEPLLVFDGVKAAYDELNLNIKEFNESYKTYLNAGEILNTHKSFYLTKAQVLEQIESFTKLAFQSITSANNFFNPDTVLTIKTSPIINYSKRFELLASDIARFKKQNKTVILAGENSSSSVHLEKFLSEKKINAKLITSSSQIKENNVYILTKKIRTGFNLPSENIILIGSGNLFGKPKEKALKRRSKKAVFTLPKVGEYVVHDTHGIGLCTGISRLKIAGYEKDYILIKYAGDDMLYLPTEQVELISSFVGHDKEPKLNKIGGAEFARQKERVKNSVKKMAVDLLKLYSEREKTIGYKFEGDEVLESEFERAFEYTETEDQLAAINDINKDMASAKIMDRLICGDVGYGKTEVALRAAFKAILSGKQVAFLAPTTILAQQHYSTCLARMNEFEVKCDVLSRFKTTKQIKESLKELEEGKTDIICGTHRLLSKDVKFKNLGLLILDEEQRFGVSDKEKIKELKKNIDVITMSATPIPRTLHMSMVGIRDISLIETPPKNRQPVQTFVTEYSNALVKDAVNREMLRGGQVLVVHNRVDTIYTVYNKLKNLMPEVVMAVAHGQMKKNELENTIKDLYDGKIQLLLATTLIENGIDLPNANTLIVLNAERLGLSQLYQLRGRVGRSDRLGYSYFTYDKQKVLSESAYKRLQAINEFTELGSGFKIALRDLEIRGAGNILGKEQHGHMGRVGYDMYTKILKESVEELKGETKKKQKEIKLNIELNSYIPTSYIKEESNRFRVYNKIAGIESVDDKLKLLNELEDIYGIVPKATINLINTALIKNLAVNLNAKKVIITDKKCFIEFYEKEDLLNPSVNRAIVPGKGTAIINFEEGNMLDFKFKALPVINKVNLIIKFLSLANKI